MGHQLRTGGRTKIVTGHPSETNNWFSTPGRQRIEGHFSGGFLVAVSYDPETAKSWG